MTLIQIGSLIINLDRVTSIRDLSTTDATGQTIPGAVRLSFDRGESLDLTQSADALRTWLATNAQRLEP